MALTTPAVPVETAAVMGKFATRHWMTNLSA
jgi:hypothetical protein